MQAVLVKVLRAFPYRRSRRRLYKEEKYIAVVVYEVRRPTADAHKENKNERCVGVRAVGAGGMPKFKGKKADTDGSDTAIHLLAFLRPVLAHLPSSVSCLRIFRLTCAN